MKRIIVFIVINLAFCSFAFAQSPLAELDKVKGIKLLESTRDDVEKILAADSLTVSDNSYYQHFSMMNANVRILYSSGKCSEESDDWSVAEWKVTKITVYPKDSFNIENIGIDYSKFKKQKTYGDLKNEYVYHDKPAGIAIVVRGDKITSIIFSPSRQNYSLLCNKAEVKNYYSDKSWNRYPELKKASINTNEWANVVSLDLSQIEITVSCYSPNPARNISCSDDDNKISVSTVAEDAENDVLTYFYKVSGGKIIGQGKRVVWDLTGVKAGSYTITAGADDGCGVCGKYITKTVVVRECPGCAVK